MDDDIVACLVNLPSSRRDVGVSWDVADFLLLLWGSVEEGQDSEEEDNGYGT